MTGQVFDKAIGLVSAAFPPTTTDHSETKLFPKTPGHEIRSLVQEILPVMADRLVSLNTMLNVTVRRSHYRFAIRCRSHHLPIKTLLTTYACLIGLCLLDFMKLLSVEFAANARSDCI